MDGLSPWGSKYAAAHQVKLDLARGDIDAAERWAQANDLVIDGEFEFHREIEYLVLARVFIAQKRFEEAHALVERIYRIAQEIGKDKQNLRGSSCWLWFSLFKVKQIRVLFIWRRPYLLLSRKATSASLWMKAHRWPVCSTKPLLVGLHQNMFAGCWQHFPSPNQSKCPSENASPRI